MVAAEGVSLFCGTPAVRVERPAVTWLRRRIRKTGPQLGRWSPEWWAWASGHVEKRKDHGRRYVLLETWSILIVHEMYVRALHQPRLRQKPSSPSAIA
jgi:hypothetical protein